jgi:hypothetical protein
MKKVDSKIKDLKKQKKQLELKLATKLGMDILKKCPTSWSMEQKIGTIKDFKIEESEGWRDAFHQFCGEK